MFKDYLLAAKNIFFPAFCFSCDKKITSGYLCRQCEDAIAFCYPPRCKFCAQSLKDYSKHICKACFKKKFPYKNLITTAIYKEPLSKIIHLFKYKHYDYLADYLSKLMISHLMKINLDISSHNLLIPVPIHPQKFKERGYNQSLLLAKKLENHFKIPLQSDIICKLNNTPAQVNLKKEERKKNILGSFAVKKDLKNKQIILIDDIFTTGATVHECATMLKKNNAEYITVLTLSKTE